MWNRMPLRHRVFFANAVVVVLVAGVLFWGSFDATVPVKPEPFIGGDEKIVDTIVILPGDGRSLPVDGGDLGLPAGSFSISYLQLSLAVVLGLAGFWLLSRVALRPLGDLSAAVESLDGNDMLPEPASRDEVWQLTVSFNKMLGKLGRTFAGQRQFVENAAHELRTPISAILANIEVLELDSEPGVEECREVIAAAKANALRMSALVEDLLLLSGEGVGDGAVCSVLFSQLDLFAGLEDEVAAKGISIVREGDLLLQGNPVLLERAFRCLVENAVRYNNIDGEIKLVCYEDRVEVRDTGPGIPASVLERIFEVFYCVDESRARSMGGGGLGLAVAKQIFGAFGYVLSVDSVEGKGTTFTVALKS